MAFIKTGTAVESDLEKFVVMEHSTIKKILIGLFFCAVLFALSFLWEEKSKTTGRIKDNPETQVVTEQPETER